MINDYKKEDKRMDDDKVRYGENLDRVEWNFLFKWMEILGFDKKWIWWV